MKQKSVLLIFSIALAIAFFGFVSHSESAEKTKISIQRFEVSENLGAALGGFLYDVLLERMVDSGKYTVVDWEELDRIQKYIADSQPNVSEKDAREQAGNQLGIEMIYVGSLKKVGSQYFISVKVLKLDLSVVDTENKFVKSEDDLWDGINQIADQLLGLSKKAKQTTEASHPQKGRLFVETEPKDARVRILNIMPRYRSGIELDAGDYLIETSKRGFATQERWVRVASGEQKEIKIQLTAIGSAPKPGDTWREPVTGMQFVWIPGGCFTMGSPVAEVGRREDESPEHPVCVDGFWMGKTEVTNEQYRKSISGHRSGAYGGLSLDGNKQPVARVSWYDARAFAGWLTQRNNGRYKFRLPTEAEWEYACRAGKQTSRFWGNSSNAACRFANVMDPSARQALAAKSNHNCEDGFIVTAPVGSFKPNGLRLYDMLGSVMEWCEDIYAKDGYRAHSYKNPKYTGNGSQRVIRGGSWSCGPSKVRSAFRDHDKHESRFPDVGFRLIKNP